MSVLHNEKAARWAYLLGSVSCAGVMVLLPVTSSLAAESVMLEEVTVSAQRREENNQTVPIAITTVSGDDLELRGAVDIRTLSTTVPNLTTQGGFASNLYIRGVGSNSSSPNVEPSVATYIDGVYNPSHYGMTSFDFNNVERIEVLKGPQGTLFGRNATGGVVQIITPDPKHELGGNVRVGYGNYNTIDGSLYLTGGLTDNLAADVAVIYEDQQDGWGYNPTTKSEIFVHKNLAARSKWLYAPSDLTKVTMMFDYSNFESDGINNQMIPGSVGIDRVTTFPGEYNAVGEATETNSKQYGAALRIDHDFTALHGVSITSYRNVSGYWHADNDNTPTKFTSVDNYNDADYWSQELQLSNRDPGRIEWLVGAFFYGNQVELAPQLTTGTRVTPGQYSAAYGSQDTQSISGFGQATMEIFAKTKLTLGVRYTDETLKSDGRRVNSAGQVFAGPFHDEIGFNPWTWRVALDHQFTPDVLGYVSYNRGFKSGGYNLANPGTIPFLPETVDAYEVGVKSEFMDHRLRLNLAAFYYDYKDLQVAIAPGNGTQIFTNAAAARNYGLDAGLDFAATDRLTLSAGLGLLNAEYLDYPDAQGFTATGVTVPVPNAKGQEIPYSPPFSGYISATYRVPLSSGGLNFGANLSHMDPTQISPTGMPERPSYDLLSASVEWLSKSDKPFGVRLWGRNLTDSYYYKNMISSANGWYGSPGEPLTYGLTLSKKY